jgi:hypothetical protein
MDAAYTEALPKFERARSIAIACYVIGGGLAITGFLLHRRAKQEAAVQVTAVPLPEGGGFVSLEWSR